MKVLINLSNHKSEQFTKEQKEYNDTTYDEVVDLPFPQCSKEQHEEEYLLTAEQFRDAIKDEIIILIKNHHRLDDFYVDIMICGEWGMTYLLVNQAKELQKYWQKAKMNRIYMDVVYPSSERIILERDGKTTHVFQFDRYRRYM